MKKLDLTYLNNLQWYRPVKIAYLALFFISMMIVARDSFSVFKPKLDVKNSYIVCQNGQQFSLGDKNFALQGRALATGDDLSARRLCMSDAEIGAQARAYSFWLGKDMSLSDEELGKKVRTGENFMYQNIYMQSTPKEQNYQITEVFVKKNILAVLLWLLLPSLLIVAIFEIIRRVFYYIILDTFIPEKMERYLFFKLKS